MSYRGSKPVIEHQPAPDGLSRKERQVVKEIGKEVLLATTFQEFVTTFNSRKLGFYASVKTSLRKFFDVTPQNLDEFRRLVDEFDRRYVDLHRAYMETRPQ